MATFVIQHQYEIRYTPILNFSNVIRDPIAPFVKFAKRITIENEGLHNEKITLIFDDEFFHITVLWDRIVFRFEGDVDTLSINNSIVEEPFFNLFEKYRGLKNFGEINNILYYSFVIHPLDISKQDILDKFTSKYLKTLNEIVPDPTDYAIILENNVGVKQMSLTFGPYIGESDIKKRGFTIKNPLIIDIGSKLGMCCEFKYFDIVKNANFSDYKEIAKIQRSYIQKIWEL